MTSHPTASPSDATFSTLHSAWQGLWVAATSSPWIAAGFAILVLLTAARAVHAVAHTS
ncbi:hypothetical protein ACSMXN_09060 [Jatrophihabitans sp. DSM 45814]